MARISTCRDQALEQARALLGLFGEANPGIVEQVAADRTRAYADGIDYGWRKAIGSQGNPDKWDTIEKERDRMRAEADKLERGE